MWRAGHFVAFIVIQIIFVLLLDWFEPLRPEDRSGLLPWGIATGLFVFLFGPAFDAGIQRLLRGKHPPNGEPVPQLSEARQTELQRTYAALPTSQLEALLESPSDLQPGADDIIRAELKRRNTAQCDH